MDREISDLTIIGAGPTGLFAAFYAGLRRMRVQLVDSLPDPGGQLATLYPEKYIYDVAGFPAVRAKDLVARLVEQANQYHPTYHLGQQVRELHHNPETGVYTIHTDRAAHPTRAILIAAGVGAFRPKTLPLTEAARFEGRGLAYAVRHVDDYRGKRLLIVGGGDSAVDWANTLAPVTAQQTLIHRRDAFRAHEDSVAHMLDGPTRVLTFHELRALEGDDHLRRAIIYDNRSSEGQEIDVDAVLVNVGFESSLGPIAGWGLELRGGQVVVDHTMMTSRPGVFAAGDVCAYPGKLKLLATGFGEACTAVNHAKKFIDPKAALFPGHSTNLKQQ
jgi:thioredoxin reductase (NADPH)